MTQAMGMLIKRYGTDGISLMLNHVSDKLQNEDETLAEEVRDIAELLRKALREEVGV